MRLKIAESFQKVLEGMESSIAKCLLEDHEFTDFANYLAIRSENEETFISYLPKGKELEYNDEGQWSRKNRQLGKPGKIARKLIGEGVFNDHDYEIFYNEISGKTNTENIEFVFSGELEDFEFAYLEDNYLYPDKGNLGNSCMRYKKCQDYIRLYYDIDAKIVYAKQKGKVIGRAIVWPTNEGYLLDRIYGCDDTVRYSILEYAKNEIGIALEALRTLPALKVLFTVQEEIGAVGASYASIKFFDDCRFVLECDRKGNSDIITSIYHEKICSDEFLYDIKPIFKSYGYSKNNGLLTDVVELRDNNLNLSCVNISCGYYNPHTDEEYTVLKDLQNCLEMVLEICSSVTNTYLHENHKFYNYYNDSFGGFMCDVCSSMDCGNCPYYSNEGVKYDLYEKK